MNSTLSNHNIEYTRFVLMVTAHLKMTGYPEHDRTILAEAATIIRNGGLVAFPTETVYGLGADAFNTSAVQKIFDAKERPTWDPLIVHVGSAGMLKRVLKAEPPGLNVLIRCFMPGALTVVVEKSDRVPEIVTAGRQTVAVRIPAHPVALELIRACQTPVAAPSANRFGKPSPTTAGHVLQDLEGKIDAVLDAGPSSIGVESTVLDLTTEPPTLLRPGGVTKEQLEAVIGEIQTYTPSFDEAAGLPSPGLSVRHYAPRALLIPIEPTLASLQSAIETWLQSGKLTGIMLPSDWDIQDLEGQARIYDWGNWGDWQILAQQLFSGFRWLDAQGVEVILVPLPPAEDLASAIRDRILRASQTE